MTLKGKKNHYNVKLLKGYGCSIRMKGNRVALRGGSDPFTGEAETEEFFVTQIPYERIVISGKGYVSTEAISVLATHNVNVILLDSFGNLITNMCKTMSSETGTKHRIAQYDTFRDPEKALYLQKQLLSDKLASQQHFLREIKNRTKGAEEEKEASEIISRLSSYAEKISSCKEKRDLLRIEAGAGRIYFLYYTSLFDSKYVLFLEMEED
jgi:CRISP-associated protein Cas1